MYYKRGESHFHLACKEKEGVGDDRQGQNIFIRKKFIQKSSLSVKEGVLFMIFNNAAGVNMFKMFTELNTRYLISHNPSSQKILSRGSHTSYSRFT